MRLGPSALAWSDKVSSLWGCFVFPRVEALTLRSWVATFAHELTSKF